MNTRLLLLLAFAAAGPVLDLSTQAEARRRVPAIIGFGETTSAVGELPPEAAALAREATGETVEISYLYSSLRVMFMNLWTWDGKYVLEGDESYYELAESDWADLGVDPEEDYGKPFVYRFPPALIIVILGLIFFVASAVMGGDEYGSSE